MRKKYLFLLLTVFLLLGRIAHADTFFVTNNADSGPGSLRDAIILAAANGTAVNDNILFNIADNSRAGRTITLLSELPELTSNLIIDGSSQPGTTFGVSNAKVILFLTTSQPNGFSFFKFADVSNIQVYGLYLFNEVRTVFTGFPAVNGISFRKSRNIIIGAPGKGNYFRGTGNCITSMSGLIADTSNFITVQSNVFNSDENGDPTITYNMAFIDPMQYIILLYNTRNVLVGGDNANEGNLTNGRELIIRSRVNNSGYLKIKNNTFNTKQGGIIDAMVLPPLTMQLGDALNSSDYDVTFENNILHGNLTLGGLTKYFIIQKNSILNHRNVSPTRYRLYVYSCSGGGRIGGDLPGQDNIIYTTDEHYGTYLNNVDVGAVFIGGSPGVSILKNTMYCNSYYRSSITHVSPGIPYVRVQTSVTNFASGKATPGSRVDVYLDDQCSGCEGEIYLGQTTANPDSTWSFSGTFTGPVVATSTNAAGTTSEFSHPTFNTSNLIKKDPVCNQNNGSITNMLVYDTWDHVEWRMVFTRNNILVDSLVTTNIDLTNAGPGQYYFVVFFKTTCTSPRIYFQLYDFSPTIDETNAQVTQPACGQPNGRIDGIRINQGDYSRVHWQDAQGNTYPGTRVGSAFVALENIFPGDYRLIVTDTTVGCADTSAWYSLVNQNGPSLNTTNIQITAATCNNSDGSITNITSNNVTGTPTIIWIDSLNNIVGNSLNLLNQPPGKYKLKFKDQGPCDTIFSVIYVIPAIGRITIDTSLKNIRGAGCTLSNGSISNLSATGADTYQWQNITINTPVGNSLNIFNIPAGNYQLTASNSFGCSLTLPPMVVPHKTFTPIAVLELHEQMPNCGLNNGMAEPGFNNDRDYFTFEWINSNNQIVSTNPSVSTFGPGSYVLVATDTNGCRQQISSITMVDEGYPTIHLERMQIINDKCSQQTGAINGISVSYTWPATGVTWRWVDQNNSTVGNTPDLSQAAAGQYRLIATVGNTCTVQSDWLTIPNDDVGTSPQCDDQVVARHTSAIISVKNVEAGTYTLYSDAAGIQPLQQNTTGVFTTPVNTGDAVYYVRHIKGTCVSPLVQVKVTVVDKVEFAIATGFTPNHDGHNDLLKLNVLGFIDVEYFMIYNRNGKLVYRTKTIGQGWDGRINGIEQPTGVFAWIAKGKDILGNTITGKGTFILIR